MQLNKKKELASKVLGVGKARIFFVNSRLNEIKEAITRQDIKDLYNDGAIRIKEKIGRRKLEKRKHRRGMGRVKKKVKRTKREYIIITRKLRKNIQSLKDSEDISKEEYNILRKKIKVKTFKTKQNLKDFIKSIKEKI